MNKFELAHLAWPILIQAAKARHLINYGDLAHALGYRGSRAMRFALAPIQDLCLEKGWPPLTSIVVNKRTGLPGEGFIAWPGDLEDAHSRVFDFDWKSVPRPFPPLHRQRFVPMRQTASEIPANFEVPDSEVVVNGRGPYQTRFREMLIDIYGGRCAVCNTRYPAALIASHIVPWAFDQKNRLNPKNGILLCHTHDAVFESGLMQIRTDYQIVLGRLDQTTLGSDFAAFLRQSTAERPRLPRSEYRPAEKFLAWRLDQQRRI